MIKCLFIQNRSEFVFVFAFSEFKDCTVKTFRLTCNVIVNNAMLGTTVQYPAEDNTEVN